MCKVLPAKYTSVLKAVLFLKYFGSDSSGSKVSQQKRANLININKKGLTSKDVLSLKERENLPHICLVRRIV